MNMSRDIKDDLLPKLQDSYARRNREGKTRMLDELSEDYGYERKYAINLLGDTVLDREARRELRDRYESLDPFALQAELERRLKPILAGAAQIARRPAGGSPKRGGLTEPLH